MSGEERRNQIIQTLRSSNQPVAGKDFAKQFDVSRQVIVQDIALLRAKNYQILSTNHGYILQETKRLERVFKVAHSDDRTREEMELILDFGGYVEDVFIYHRVYGIIRADLNVHTKEDIDHFLEDIKSGKSSLLKNVTSNYHYHTVSAPTEIILDLIQKQLQEHGFLVALQEYEPIDFWSK